MRFMMMVKADKNYEAGTPPDPKLMAAMDEYTEKMIKAGVVLQTGGLLPSAQGARIRATGGRLVVTDGPFTETKELIGGYAIVRAASKDEAIKVGSEFMKLHTQVLGGAWEGELEIRQLADFGPE
jgi:hypothetical protein